MYATIVDLATMRSLDEVPIESVSVSDATNGAGDGDITISLGGRPQAVEQTRPWKYGVAISDEDYNPLWFGIITRRAASAATRKYRLSATQVEGWLARVWLPDAYDADYEADADPRIDAASAIALRLDQLKHFQASFPDRLPVPLPSNAPAPTDRFITISWQSPWTASGVLDWQHPYSRQYGAQYARTPATAPAGVFDWRGSPATVLDDINAIGDKGYSWGLVPVEHGGSWAVELDVRPITLAVDRTIQVGLDVADAEIIEDGDAQATEWFVSGAAELDIVVQARYATPGDARKYPILMGTRTYENVGTEKALAALADDIAAAYGPAPLSTSSIKMPGIVRIRPGEVVELVVPPALYANWPNGTSWIMRAATVTWRSEGGAISTEVDIVAPREHSLAARSAPHHVVPSARASLAGVITDLSARLARVESRK